MSLEIWARHHKNFFESIQRPKPVVQNIEAIEQAPVISFLTAKGIYDDIIPVISTNKFYALSLLGPQGSGKTICASEFATFAKQDGFRLVYSRPEDFMKDMEAWINKILENPAEKYMLVLEDLSYYMDTQSRKNQSIVKNLISRIRHKFQGEMFIVYITHRYHSVPPMLRNGASWIFSSMQAADREDAMKLIPRRKEMRERLDQIYSFIAKATIEGPRDGKFVYQVGEQKTVFRWGNKEDPGDGRLMASYHAGDMKIFNSKVVENMVDLEDYRVLVSSEAQEPDSQSTQSPLSHLGILED